MPNLGRPWVEGGFLLIYWPSCQSLVRRSCGVISAARALFFSHPPPCCLAFALVWFSWPPSCVLSRELEGCPLCHAAGSRVLARCEPGGFCCLLGGFSVAWCFGISHRIPAPLLPEMDFRVGDSCRVNLCGANKFICWMAQMQECLISDALGWRVGFY